MPMSSKRSLPFNFFPTKILYPFFIFLMRLIRPTHTPTLILQPQKTSLASRGLPIRVLLWIEQFIQYNPNKTGRTVLY
jgi:hypothetical protein